MPTIKNPLLDITKKSTRNAIILRFIIPNFVFIPFFIFGFHTGPFILALILRGWLQRSVEHHFSEEWSFAYMFYHARKLMREGKLDEKNPS